MNSKKSLLHGIGNQKETRLYYDSWADNYDATANTDNGTCVISGCIDDGQQSWSVTPGTPACNYDSTATTSDGSCTYSATYYDCSGNCLVDTDGDGVCNELEVLGCTDSEALNYNLNATLSFKSIYNSPGEIMKLYNFFKEQNINESISIEEFINLIIEKNLFKKSLFIKKNLGAFIELYFQKKINFYKSKDKFYNLYKYFLFKINECNKYNLDIESILIEFEGKIING